MDYQFVDDDFRRGVVNNNLQSVEREHASTALALDVAKRMISTTDDLAIKDSYKQQAKDLEARLNSLTAQVESWNQVLATIPDIASTTLKSDADRE